MPPDFQLTDEQIRLLYKHAHSWWAGELGDVVRKREHLQEILPEFAGNAAAEAKLREMIEGHGAAVLAALRKDVVEYIGFWHEREQNGAHPDPATWAQTELAADAAAFTERFAERMIAEGLEMDRDPKLGQLVRGVIRGAVEDYARD